MNHLITTTLRERDGRFYAVFYDPDRGQKWRTLRTSDRREARKRLHLVDDDVSRGTLDPWESALPEHHVSLAKAAARYVEQRERSQLSRETVRSDRSLLKGLCDHLPRTQRVASVTRAKLEGFFQALVEDERKDSTLRTYHTRLSHFFAWCARERLIRRDPMRDVPKPSVGDILPRFLSHAEFDRLVAAVYDDADEKARGVVDGEPSKHTSVRDGDIVWLVDVLFFAVETGMRKREICSADWSWVDLDGRSIWVPTNKRSWARKGEFSSKSGRARRVPFGVGSATEEVLLRLRAEPGGGEGPVFKGQGDRAGAKAGLNGTYLSKRFKLYCAKAGLSDAYVFHTLRHTCASWLVMAGRHLVEVKEILGHQSIDTTVRWYAHLDPERLNAAADAVFGGNAARIRRARSSAGR